MINPSALSISLTLPPFTDRVGWWWWLGPIAEDVTAVKEEAPAFSLPSRRRRLSENHTHHLYKKNSFMEISYLRKSKP
jgi:hypothetical protein